MPLVQLHHQFGDGHTDVKAQRDINNKEEMLEFMDEMRESFPLPEGAGWLAVLERSKHFVGVLNDCHQTT
ncbi:MAG: hypothetical protein ACYSSO_10695 [Planctomycetota bacterium]